MALALGPPIKGVSIRDSVRARLIEGVGPWTPTEGGLIRDSVRARLIEGVGLWTPL